MWFSAEESKLTSTGTGTGIICCSHQAQTPTPEQRSKTRQPILGQLSDRSYHIISYHIISFEIRPFPGRTSPAWSDTGASSVIRLAGQVWLGGTQPSIPSKPIPRKKTSQSAAPESLGRKNTFLPASVSMLATRLQRWNIDAGTNTFREGLPHLVQNTLHHDDWMNLYETQLRL